jgi:hypothetical protein
VIAKPGGTAIAARVCDETHAVLLARSVRRDFVDLVAIFDQQLSTSPRSDRQGRFHLAKARAAAERGLRLSQELIEAMSR